MGFSPGSGWWGDLTGPCAYRIPRAHGGTPIGPSSICLFLGTRRSHALVRERPERERQSGGITDAIMVTGVRVPAG